MSVLFVNGEPIDEGAIATEAQAVAKLMAERMPTEAPDKIASLSREWAEENLIEAALMRQEAVRIYGEPAQELPTEDEVRACLERLMASLVAQSDATPIEPQAVAVYYNEQVERFQTPERVRVAHIVKHVGETASAEEARRVIELARSALAEGMPFAEVADRFSDCPGQGGDLGTFPRGEMVERFDDVVFGMETGEVSGIFETEFGFHIATLLGRIAPAALPLDEVAGEIERELGEQRREEFLHRYVDGLREQAVIERRV